MRMFKLVMMTGHEYEINEDQLQLWRKNNSNTGKLRPFFALKREPGEELWINLEHVAHVEFTHEVEDPKPAKKQEDLEPAKEKSRKKTKSDIDKEIMDELMKKSSCTHENHDIYYKDMKGPNNSVSRKYFPVCSFCGLRERFVKSDSLTDEQKENAKRWAD